MKLNIRKADVDDLYFLVKIDLKDEGITTDTDNIMSPQERLEHREKIRTFVMDEDRGALILEDQTNKVGTIMYCISCRDKEYPWKTIFNELDRNLFQEDGRFLEIFLLWVHPSYRRIGHGTELKLKVEEEAELHGVNLIYTHTEERNMHVIELNNKLGYKEVRRGPIWDSVVRVSLIKHI
ncbi:hypothetical protein BVG16_26585 [Paenibacillus selenitireducens]|uniref:N-acetyltransferase domain-containing protein n=1 Tax=Paenibacillus selenitireducens TaxID=1324314 RepID=A0A1T2X1D3_9BACL|nr:GNAT family N-acetyltransferase [Paenibacillus selenitireducens]OPA73670.1 hypothetical protein BVG16_26585 [Paenibacillus selenitireducens]